MEYSAGLRKGLKPPPSMEQVVSVILGDAVPTTRDVDLNLPKLAKDQAALDRIEAELKAFPTSHKLILGDARRLDHLQDHSVHLVVTSPPYWTLKEYNHAEGQLGDIAEYRAFHEELSKAWRECYRVLVPGGRLVVVVGDVCVSRREYGRHKVFPLHADIQVNCEAIGFDNLTPIIWNKISNASFEAGGNSGAFLGKPFEPNAVVKSDVEFILMLRKPGGYRSPPPDIRLLSIISAENHRRWFTQVWTDVRGASLRDHPAPYPVELADRLIRMFSFVGDTVLDPFCGTGTSILAAMTSGRNSVGVEIDPSYFDYAKRRIEKEATNLYGSRKFEAIREGVPSKPFAPGQNGKRARRAPTKSSKKRA
jgi:DNA modification methylase